MSPANVPRSVEPGTRLVDRYRLEESLGETEGTTYWRAQDELLDRDVGVCLLQGDHDSAQRVLGAARRAAAVTDPRFLRVLDANEADGVVYVVSEWVSASNLADLLADRPLSPAHAHEMAAEVAGALDAAHGQGLAHLCLTPEHVLRTSHGQIKVAGLAVDAAVHGLSHTDFSDAVAQDTRGVAAILYAALTARWPGDQATRVAPAPMDGDRVCSPRQVRAGVPDELDALVAQTLGAVRNGNGNGNGADNSDRAADRGAGGAAPSTPAEFNRRLSSSVATSRIPVVRPASEPHGDTPPPYSSGPFLARYDDEGSRRGRLAGRAAYLLVGLVLLVGLGLAGWQLASTSLGGGQSADNPTTSGKNDEPPAKTSPIKVASATTLDPQGDGEENSDRAERVLDGDDSTVWTTKTYQQQFGPGGIKDGVGLLLDLGSRQSVASLRVSLLGDATDLQVRLADEQGPALADYDQVGEASDASGNATVTLDDPTEARYVLIWLTKIPPAADGGFRGEIADVVVNGGS